MAIACRIRLLAVCCGWLCAFLPPASALENQDVFTSGWKAHIGASAGGYAISWGAAPDGRRAIRFELRAGDCMANQVNDCRTHRERAELRSTDEAPLGTEWTYRFSVYVPQDFPEIGVDEIIGQMHDAVAPVLSNRYRNGHVSVVVQSRKGAADRRQPVPDALFGKGRWVAFAYHCRWSKGADGFMKISVDGVEVLNHVGPTVSQAAPRGPYLKVGLYRSHLDRFKGGKTPTGVIFVTLPEISRLSP